MRKPKPNGKKGLKGAQVDLSTGDRARTHAERHNCRTRRAGGSHSVVYLPNGEQVTVPDGQLSPGVLREVLKAFAAAGILTALAVLLLPLL